MPKGAAVVPDAWDDDDWEVQADRMAKEEPKPPSPKPILSKAERQAEHQASNRKLWQEASEVKETMHFVEATNNVPLSSGFKPQVKVLSRKPVIAKRDPASGMSQLSIDDDDDDAASKEPTLSAEEIRAKQRKDREEKQRRYDEARAKIFGESAPSSRGSSPGISGTTTPPRQDSRRGGRGGRGGARGGGYQQQQQQQGVEPQTRSPGPRELYDPNYASRDGSQRRQDDTNARQKDEGAPIRAPRGPDASGRGGFGFARRGGN